MKCERCGRDKKEHEDGQCPYNGHYYKGLYIGHEYGTFKKKKVEDK